MGGNDGISGGVQLPTSGLEILDQVSKARDRGETVRVIDGKVKPREAVDVLSDFGKADVWQRFDSEYLNSIKDAARALKREVLQKSGPVTWKYIEKKVPELVEPTNKTEAKALIKAIKKAYGEKSMDAAAQIDLVLKRHNPVVDHPVQAENFDDYLEGLKLRGDQLAKEFAPGGDAWSLVEDLTKIPANIPEDEKLGAQILLQADIRAYITEHGFLPERSEVLDMAIDRARYIFPEIAKDLPKFATKKEADFQDSSIKLGFRDFPNEEVREYVEALARTSVDTPWDGERQHRDIISNPIRTYYNGDFQKAMYDIWSNEEVMFGAYSSVLEMELAEIDKTPTTPDNLREQLTEKLKLFSPGAQFYTYLETFYGDPRLNGESVTEYRRLLAKTLDVGPAMNPAKIARDAYLKAQRVEIARRAHRDLELISKLAEPFPSVLAVQLKKERAINWVHVIEGDERKGFVGELSGQRLANKAVNEDGFALDFEADVSRASFAFDLGSGTTRVKPGDAKEVKRHLRLISGGNKMVQATLSKLINQNGIAMPMEAYAQRAYNPLLGEEGDGPSWMFRESQALGGRSNFDYAYTLRNAPNNKVICEYDLFRVGDQVMVNGRSIFPINRDATLSGDVSNQNYAERQRVAIELDRKDLEKGIIKPKFITPPTVELHIKPDWGKIALLAKESKLSEFDS